ncbi:hypothetical protein [uncultured Sphingomonas sp.]|uniref:hypothetical protein n=1 Tax=uncultured Sphingomonas sp. TaxID=158754 RepID=UPI0035CA3DEC
MRSPPMHQPSQTAAIITTRLLKPGREDEFARWAERLDEAAKRDADAAGVVRLEQPSGLVYAVHRFRTEQDARRWRDAPARHAFDAEAEAFSSGCSQLEIGARIQVRVPSETAIPKWKMWLATWLAVFPLLLALSGLISLFPADLPPPVELAATSLVMTATLTWLVLPRIRRSLRPWLLAGEDGGLRKEPG